MKKQNNKLKGGQGMKSNKTIPVIVWSIAGVLLMAFFVSAGTSISNSQSSFAGNVKLNTLDAILQVDGYNSLINAGVLINQTRPEAKSGIVFSSYDQATDKNRLTGWFVCHYNSTLNNYKHSHCSIETLDNVTGTPSINSHLTIEYGGNLTAPIVNFPDSQINLNGFALFRSGISKLTPTSQLDIYPNGQQSLGQRISNDSTGIVNSILGGTTFAIAPTDMLQLKGNASSMSCGETTEGSLYYNNATKKHYGCDGTNWNALY